MAEERRMGWLVGALSQKRLVKHAINNETFCLSASRAVSRSLLPFVRPLVSGELFGSSYRRSRSRHLSTLSYHQKTTNLEPDLMTHFSRPSLLPSLALLLQMTRQTATAAAAVAVNCDASTDREKELTD